MRSKNNNKVLSYIQLQPKILSHSEKLKNNVMHFDFFFLVSNFKNINLLTWEKKQQNHA